MISIKSNRPKCQNNRLSHAQRTQLLSRVKSAQFFRQIRRRYALCYCNHVFRNTLEHHFPTSTARLRSQIDNPISTFYHIQIVLDTKNRIALRNQCIERFHQFLDVVKMQARCGFVENKQCAAFFIRTRLAQEKGQLNPLCFSSTQGIRPLP